MVLLVASLAASGTAPTETTGEFVPPEGLVEGWYARIDTSEGRILARLLPDQAPQSVAHFAALAQGRLGYIDSATGEAKKGPYYDGIRVHLAEAGRRFEIGDPTGTGHASPPFYVPPQEGVGRVTFTNAGRLGMARLSGGRISGVQFFVTAAGMPWLIGSYPCFGEVVSDMEVVFRISQVKTYNNGRPIEPVVIERVRIFSVGNPAPLPDPEPYFPKPVLEERIPSRAQGRP